MINAIKRFASRNRNIRFSQEYRISILKNSYKNRRAFVIGNGPSLKIKDLERIQKNGDMTIASNKIYLSFEETKWRPDFLSVADWCVAENNKDALKKLPVCKIFPENFSHIFDEKDNGCTLFFKQFVPESTTEENYVSYFFHDLREGAFVGETITNFNIQLASYLGCKEIYLIGVDGSYHSSQTTVPHKMYGEVFESSGEINHFHPEYRKQGETWSIPRVNCHEKNYSLCLKELNAKGVLLANASRRTEVKALPKVAFDSLFD